MLASMAMRLRIPAIESTFAMRLEGLRVSHQHPWDNPDIVVKENDESTLDSFQANLKGAAFPRLSHVFVFCGESVSNLAADILGSAGRGVFDD